jgi:NAD(P)H-flavin reductase
VDKTENKDWKGYTGYVTKDILKEITALDEK